MMLIRKWLTFMNKYEKKDWETLRGGRRGE